MRSERSLASRVVQADEAPASMQGSALLRGPEWGQPWPEPPWSHRPRPRLHDLAPLLEQIAAAVGGLDRVRQRHLCDLVREAPCDRALSVASQWDDVDFGLNIKTRRSLSYLPRDIIGGKMAVMLFDHPRVGMAKVRRDYKERSPGHDR
jgi:hypothetical protein